MASEQETAIVKLALAEGQKAQRRECETLRREKRTLEARIASLQSQLDALSWTAITPENLPKVGDEVVRLIAGLHREPWNVVECVIDDESTATAWIEAGYTHRRPLNPPPPSGAKGETS